MCEEVPLSFMALLACLLACLVYAENADLMRRKESTVTARPAMDTDRPMMVMMLRASWCSWGRADWPYRS